MRITFQNEILILNIEHEMNLFNIDIDVITIFYQMNKNRNPHPKAISTNNTPKIKVKSVLESSTLTLQNEILILRTGHD